MSTKYPKKYPSLTKFLLPFGKGVKAGYWHHKTSLLFLGLVKGCPCRIHKSDLFTILSIWLYVFAKHADELRYWAKQD